MIQLYRVAADALRPFRGWPLLVALTLLAVYFAGYIFLTPFPWGMYKPPDPSPCAGNEVAGTVEAEFFRLPEHRFPRPTKVLLRGSFAKVHLLPTATFLAYGAVLLAAATAMGIVSCLRNRRVWRVAFLALTALSAFYLSLRFGAGWDEFFLNLRHSWVLMQGGGFSANLGERIIATVDVLPFLLPSALSWVFRMRLEDAALVVTLLGTLLCIVCGYLLVLKRAASAPAAVLTSLLLSIFPPLLYVGGAGFMAGLFSGLFLLAYLLISADRQRTRVIGYGVVSILPWVRYEAFGFILVFWLLASAAWLYDTWRQPSRPSGGMVRVAIQALGWGAGLIAPFVLLSLWQWHYFGTPVATPVTYKATLGSLHYLRLGIDQFYRVLEGYAVGKAMIVLLPAIVLYLLRRPMRETAFALALVALSLGYHTAGGDWFIDQWARYLIPLLTFLIPISIVSASLVLRVLSRQPRMALAVLAAGAALVLALLPSKVDNLYRVSYIVDAMKPIDRWERTLRLAAIGHWFGETTEPTARIASSELATMMYFAERDLVGLLGTASEYGAHTPLQPMLSSPIVGKRRFPEIIERLTPEVIALYEPVATTGRNRARDIYLGAVQGWSYNQATVDINYYLAGSSNVLKRLGYRNIVAAVDNYVFTYWVSADAYAGHVAAMKRLGAVPDGTLTFPFHVTPQYAETYQAAGVCVRG